MHYTNRIRLMLSVSLVAVFIGLQGCAVNPATGQREINFVSEAQEIQMGREADPAATAQFGGLYPDNDLRAYITQLGNSIAEVSERPELPWSFKLVDHDLINAFALPGGFVYITRGILANMNSEAELMGVLGHEVGHVTARHSAQQMTQQQLGMIGFIGGAIFSETVRNNADAVMQGLQLLSLKYGRDDEAQSDELGYRYLLRTEHDPQGITNVMRMLESTSPSAEEMGVPGWMLSHPNPGDRVVANERRIARSGQDFSDFKLGRDEFLQRLDGLVYGKDPRQGYFIGQRFIHPGMDLELTFPSSWTTQNSSDSVAGQAEDSSAVMQLSLSSAATPQAALSQFLQQQSIAVIQSDNQSLNGLNSSWAEFSVSPADGQQGQSIRGYVLYAEQAGLLFQIIGYTEAGRWATHGRTLFNAITSLQPVTNQRYKDVSPHRLKIVRLSDSMTGSDFLSRYPSSVYGDDVLLANQIKLDDRLESGRLMKQIVGGKVPTE